MSETIELIPTGKNHYDKPTESELDKHHSDPPSTEDLHDVELTPGSSTTLLRPLECFRVEPGHSIIPTLKWALVFFGPVLNIAYLAFCYAVHYRLVAADVPNATSQILSINLGAGITTVNIIIISIALFPLKGLLYELQSEEFFRLLSTPRNSRGVKLNVVNGISTASYSFTDSISAAVYQYCSIYYIMALIAVVIIWAFSTLAPAALSIQPILIDGPIMAFSIGAIPPLALYQPVAGGQILLPSQFSPAPGYSAAIVWAEREIGLSFSFSVANDSQGIYTGFSVPTPPILNSTASARWLTDVIGFKPYCTWANPVNLTKTFLNYTMNSTKVPENALSVHLEGLDLKVEVLSSYFRACAKLFSVGSSGLVFSPTANYNSSFVTSINVHDPTVTVSNYTTGSLPTDGAMIMSVIQCTSSNCTKEAINIVSLFVDFTDVPSLNFSTIGTEYEMGFLVCKPNISIETREVRTQGSMLLEVQPLIEGAPPYPKQGNLDWTQTSLLVAYSLSGLTTGSGPASSAWNGLGSITQVDFMFGSEQMKSIPTSAVYENTSMVLTPLSSDQLAQGYTQMVTTSMKPYISGLLGSSNVPGRIATVRQVFVSSLSHVIASTVLFILLFAMAIVAHFRPRKGDQFTLANIAAALAESEFPDVAKRTKVDVMAGMEHRRHRRWLREGAGQEVARVLRDWKVSLKAPDKADGVDVLHISRE